MIGLLWHTAPHISQMGRYDIGDRAKTRRQPCDGSARDGEMDVHNVRAEVPEFGKCGAGLREDINHHFRDGAAVERPPPRKGAADRDALEAFLRREAVHK